MPSQLLFVTSCLRASYQAAQNVLHLEWQGSLTLSAVQVASAQVAQLGLVRRYPRVLIRTEQVRTVSYDVASWLAPNVLPGLCLIGARQVAWVSHASLNGVALARHFSAGLTLATRLFKDTESGLTWLGNQPNEPTIPPQTTVEITRLRRVVCVLHWKTLVRLARHPLWLLAEFPAASYDLRAATCVRKANCSSVEA